MNKAVYQKIHSLSGQYNDRMSQVIDALYKLDFDTAMSDIAEMLYLAQYLLKLAVQARDDSAIALLEKVLHNTVALSLTTAKAQSDGDLDPEKLMDGLRGASLEPNLN